MKVFLNVSDEVLYYSKSGNRTLVEAQTLDATITQVVVNAPNSLNVKTDNKNPTYSKKVTGDGTLIEHYTEVANPMNLVINKTAKYVEIDQKTKAFIDVGFTYDSKSFSLSTAAQINWNVLKNTESEFSWPVDISTKDNDTYSLIQVNLSAFWTIVKDTIKGHLDSGRVKKKQVFDAVDQEALDLVVDDR